MHKDDFTSGIERVEKLFGQEQNVYDEAVLTEIYDVVRHLDAQEWSAVVGGVIRTWGYKTLPNVSAFDKMKNQLGEIGQRTRKIRQDCPTCAGHGLRAFIYRYKDRFREGICICDCPNAENFTAPPHMTIQQARRLPGFKAADHPGEVPHLLEVLNPPPPPREPGLGDKEYPKHRQGIDVSVRTPQEARGGKGGPGTGGRPVAPGTQPVSRVQQETSSPPRTLIDTASELAGELDASHEPRQQIQDAATLEKKNKMVQDLKEWMKEDAETP